MVIFFKKWDNYKHKLLLNYSKMGSRYQKKTLMISYCKDIISYQQFVTIFFSKLFTIMWGAILFILYSVYL